VRIWVAEWLSFHPVRATLSRLSAVDSQRRCWTPCSGASELTRMRYSRCSQNCPTSFLPVPAWTGAAGQCLPGFDDKERMGSKVRTLRGGGKLSLVDFQKKADRFGPPVRKGSEDPDIPGFFQHCSGAKWTSILLPVRDGKYSRPSTVLAQLSSASRSSPIDGPRPPDVGILPSLS